MRIIVGIVLVLCSVSCLTQSQNNCAESIKKELLKAGFESPLIKMDGSKGKVPWDSVRVNIEEEKANSEYYIQLFYNNEEGRKASIAWLLIQIDDNLVLDITLDEMSPDTLQFVKDLESTINNYCRSNDVD